MKRTALITGLALACLIHLSAQQDIASARAMGVGASVTISGIITNGDELGTIRYMQDHTGGIAVYSSEMSSVQRSDSVTVNGTLKNYSSLLEVDPDNARFEPLHSRGHHADPQTGYRRCAGTEIRSGQ